MKESAYPIDLFWDYWKRLGGKRIGGIKIKTKYLNLPEKTKAAVIKGLEQQIHARCVMISNNKKFIPDVKNPGTWLNQGCWDDEVPTDKEIVDEINRERARRTSHNRAGSASWDDSI